jgi:transposase
MNDRIKARKETNLRRKQMKPVCVTAKIQENKLSSERMTRLGDMFRHAKYFYNAMINSEDIFKFDYKTKEVEVKWKEKEIEKSEIRPIFLASQIKQGLQDRTKDSLKGLKQRKKNGGKVGKLKCKKEVNSIPLKQYGHSYKIKGNKIHITGMGYMNVNGLDQVKELNVKEFGAGKLIRKATGYYVQITCYLDKPSKSRPDNEENFPAVGIDMGIKDDVTLSNGDKFQFKFDYSKIKREAKRLSRKKKDSKKWFKQKMKLKKQYEKVTNQKEDTSNKFVSYLGKNFGYIALQDENIKGWQEKFYGSKIAHGVLGRIKSKLNKLSTIHEVDRYRPTTQVCPVCTKLNKIGLEERHYQCSCGYSEDRDIKSAQCVLLYSLGQLPTEHRKVTPSEFLTTEAIEYRKKALSNFKSVTMKREATTIYGCW